MEDALHEDLRTFMIIFQLILLRTRYVSEKFRRKNQNTHLHSVISFPKILPLMRYGTARQATDDNIIRCMRFACWITKATDTHFEYVILTAFVRQNSLCERVSILRYTCIA
jgi:hypothetical protein